MLDAADARRVAGMLDIPFYVLNFQDDFGKIIDYFIGEYNAGRARRRAQQQHHDEEHGCRVKG